MARQEMASLERKLKLSEPVRRRLGVPWAGRPSEGHARPNDPAPAAFHLGPLRVVLSGVPRGRGVLRRPYRARIEGAAPLSELPIAVRPSEGEAIDLVLFWHGLSTNPDPRGVLERAVASLRPGGLVLAAAELGECEAGLRAYTAGLRKLIDEQLSQDHDWLVGPDAMAWVESLEHATDADDRAWLAANPHPCGLDLDAHMAGAGLERVASMRYGGMAWHPLTPFQAVEGVDGRDADAWACGVWKKPL